VPRYPLIIRNTTYFALYEWAGQEHMSLGKLINRILDEAVRDWKQGKVKSGEKLNPCCMTCRHYVLRNEWCPVQQRNQEPNDTCRHYLRELRRT